MECAFTSQRSCTVQLVCQTSVLTCFLVDIREVVGQTDTKIISDTNLAFLVRQMAIHANVSYTCFISFIDQISRDCLLENTYTSNS